MARLVFLFDGNEVLVDLLQLFVVELDTVLLGIDDVVALVVSQDSVILGYVRKQSDIKACLETSIMTGGWLVTFLGIRK